MENKKIAEEIENAASEFARNMMSKEERDILMKKLEGKLSAEDKKTLGLDDKSKMIGSKDDGAEEALDEKMLEKIREEYNNLMHKKFNTQFLQIGDVMARKNKTLTDIKVDIENKVSTLPSDARSVVMNFKEESLLGYVTTHAKWLEDRKKHHLNVRGRI